MQVLEILSGISIPFSKISRIFANLIKILIFDLLYISLFEFYYL